MKRKVHRRKFTSADPDYVLAYAGFRQGTGLLKSSELLANARMARKVAADAFTSRPIAAMMSGLEKASVNELLFRREHKQRTGFKGEDW